METLVDCCRSRRRTISNELSLLKRRIASRRGSRIRFIIHVKIFLAKVNQRYRPLSWHFSHCLDQRLRNAIACSSTCARARTRNLACRYKVCQRDSKGINFPKSRLDLQTRDASVPHSKGEEGRERKRGERGARGTRLASPRVRGRSLSYRRRHRLDRQPRSVASIYPPAKAGRKGPTHALSRAWSL